MNVLWASNAPFVGSGYGVQTGLFAPRIRDLGHNVAIASNWGVQGACLDWDGMRIYPSDGEWGNRTMAAIAAHHGDGDDCLTIILCDAWVLDPDRFRGMRIALWAPVDVEPLPLPCRRVLAHETVTPIAMSRFGERMMRDANLEPLYVPHGVETGLFRPQPEIRDDVREALGLPRDAFVVGVVGANQSSSLLHRKSFPQIFQAFAKFQRNHSDAVMYVHSSEFQVQGNGLPLRTLAAACGIPRGAIRFTEQFAWELGWSRQTLANAYQAFDVLASPSMGEGFGVPIIEAQASGVPVIATDHSAMTELCGAGWLVDGDPYYNAPMDAWFKLPAVQSILDALEQAYDALGTLTGKAREFALQYDVDHVLHEHWRPVMDRLALPAEVGPLVAA